MTKRYELFIEVADDIIRFDLIEYSNDDDVWGSELFTVRNTSSRDYALALAVIGEYQPSVIKVYEYFDHVSRYDGM